MSSVMQKSIEKKSGKYVFGNNSMIVIITIITFLVNVCLVFQSKMIYMSGDEMGPIAIAAYWAGEDWSSLVSHIGYYSYGYSLLLYPLFLIAKTATDFYHLAIVLNAFLTALIVPISYKVGRNLFPNVEEKYLCICSFLAANYVANISRSPSAWCEVLLTVLFWLLLLVFIELEKEISYKKVFVNSFLLMYMYAVHQRMIGVVLAYIASLLMIFRVKKYKIRYFFAFGLSTTILYACHLFIKGYVQDNVWGGLNNNLNDWGGRLSLLTEKGMAIFYNIVYTISGHMFYLAIATMGLGVFSLVVLFRKCYKICLAMKNKQSENSIRDVAIFFIFLSFIGTFLISCLSLTDNPENYARSDYLLYGRYVEPLCGILIYISVIYLINSTKKKIDIIVTNIIVIISAIFAYIRYSEISNLTFMATNSVGLNPFYWEGNLYFLTPTCITILCVSFLYWIKSKKVATIALMIIASYWIIVGMSFLANHIIPNQNYHYKYSELIEKKEKMNEDAPFYYFGDDISPASFVQFLLKGKEVLVVKTNCEELPKEKFYGLINRRDISALFPVLLNENGRILDMINDLCLFTNESENAEIGLTFPMSMFYSQIDEQLQENDLVSNEGKDGVLLYGPYIDLDEGKYIVTYSYNATSQQRECGYIKIYSNSVGEIYTTADITNTNGIPDVVTLEFELKSKTEGIEFYTKTNKDSVVEISKIQLRKVD